MVAKMNESKKTEALNASKDVSSELNEGELSEQSAIEPKEKEDAAALATNLEDLNLVELPKDTYSEITYSTYDNEEQMEEIIELVASELSEPYSIYTYRYFIYNWPHLCLVASHKDHLVGVIICKQDQYGGMERGYIAMLAVQKSYRRHRIGTKLVEMAIDIMAANGVDFVALETEITNLPALRFYEKFGFIRSKRLFRYYMNGIDAFSLKLFLK